MYVYLYLSYVYLYVCMYIYVYLWTYLTVYQRHCSRQRSTQMLRTAGSLSQSGCPIVATVNGNPLLHLDNWLRIYSVLGHEVRFNHWERIGGEGRGGERKGGGRGDWGELQWDVMVLCWSEGHRYLAVHSNVYSIFGHKVRFNHCLPLTLSITNTVCCWHYQPLSVVTSALECRRRLTWQHNCLTLCLLKATGNVKHVQSVKDVVWKCWTLIPRSQPTCNRCATVGCHLL